MTFESPIPAHMVVILIAALIANVYFMLGDLRADRRLTPEQRTDRQRRSDETWSAW